MYRRYLGVGIAILSSMVVLSQAATQPRDVAAVKKTYQEISSRLDEGGDLFVVANVDGILEEYVTRITELIKLAPQQPDGKQAELIKTISNVSGFLKKNGFYGVKGVGSSVVPREDGLNTVKMFVSREAEAAGLPLWLSFVGASPVEMGCLHYLPKNTVMARSGTGNLSALWTMVKSGVTEIGGAEAAEKFAAGVAMADMQVGKPVDEIIASLASEGVVSLQVSPEAKTAIPMGPEMVEIPQVSLLIVLAVQNDTIIDTIKNVFTTKLQMALPEQKIDDATLYPLPFPIPSPMPVQLTLARHGKYLLIGSTLSVVTEAIESAGKNSGLLSTAEFKAGFAGLPMKNNGIAFVSKRFGATIAQVQEQFLSKAMANDPNSAEAGAFLQKMMKENMSNTASLVFMNYRSGVKVEGLSSSGGREIVASMGVAPIGLLAGIAIPSFVKARETAQSSACMNNLRQLDAAKEQWAMAKRKTDGDQVVESEVLEYIKGGVMPKCPKGGTYMLNVIGENPTCTVPGHALPQLQF